MTARTSRGQRILQGRRAKGTFTPSPGTLSAQYAASLIWDAFRGGPGFIRMFWKVLTTGQTEASQFYAYAYDNAFTPDGLGSGALDPLLISYSRGSMRKTEPLTVVADVSVGGVVITWNPVNEDGSQLSTDIPWIVVKNETRGLYTTGAIPAVRSGGTSGVMTTPAGFLIAGETVIVYLSFVTDTASPDSSQVSNSGVLSTVVVA